MQNLWLAFKCLSLIAGCVFMVLIIIGLVEGIRTIFRRKSVEQNIQDMVEKLIEESFNEDKKEEK